MPSKKIFSHATIVDPANANGWQNPSWVSKKDFPDGTTQWDLQEGEYFIPPVHIEKDLVGFNNDKDTFLSGSGELLSPWGGRVTDKPLGYAHTAPFHTVDVSSGCIIDTEGVKRCWNDSPVQVIDGQVSYIYIDNVGNIVVDETLPGRIIPHTALAKITASGDLTTIEDLRPHAATGAHNDTPLQLVNTEVKTADYIAKTWERVLVNSSGGSFTIFLPESPSDGDVVAMLDVGGTLSSYPVVIASQKEVIGEIATAIQAINQESKDWIFNSNYMYIELVWSAAENSWFFQEVPDGNCDPTPGAFIRCGGAHPTITTPENCEGSGFSWNANRQQCMIPASYAVYAGNNPGEIFYTKKSKRCKCAAKADYSPECYEEKGEFLRCDGNANAYYADGNGGEIKILEDDICRGGQRRGAFIQCEGNTAVFIRDNNATDGDSQKFRIPKHPRCTQGDKRTWYTKYGFVEDWLQPIITYKRVGSGSGDYNESDSIDGYTAEVTGGFGSSADNGRTIEQTLVKWNDHPNIDEAAWARIRLTSRCKSVPCAVRTRVYLEYPRGGFDIDENFIWVAENDFTWTADPGFTAPGSSNIVWLPLPPYWKRIRVKYTAWGGKHPNDLQRANITFFTKRNQMMASHDDY